MKNTSSPHSKRNRTRFILAFDSISAQVGGCLTWASMPLILAQHKWTPEFTRFIISGNFVYGLYSGALFLLFRAKPDAPAPLLAVLVAGNSMWAVQCLFQAWRLRAEASMFGIAHLVFEAAYVGVLAYIEARIFFPARGSMVRTSDPRPGPS